MKIVFYVLAISLITGGCNSRQEPKQPVEQTIRPALQAALQSSQFDSLVNGSFNFRAKQLTLIRNKLVKTDIPLTINGMPVKFTNIDLMKMDDFDPYKPHFHAEITSFAVLENGNADLTIAIRSVGLICDIQLKPIGDDNWQVDRFKWYRT